MQVSVHLHRGDGHLAAVHSVDTSHWISIEDGKDNDVVLFIPEELVADATEFAESITAYCQKRGIMSA